MAEAKEDGRLKRVGRGAAQIGRRAIYALGRQISQRVLPLLGNILTNNARIIEMPTPQSEAIASIGWDPLLEKCYVLFRNREGYGPYEFGGIPETMFISWVSASSPGSFYHKYLKQNKKYVLRKISGGYSIHAAGRRVRNVFRLGRRTNF